MSKNVSVSRRDFLTKSCILAGAAVAGSLSTRIKGAEVAAAPAAKPAAASKPEWILVPKYEGEPLKLPLDLPQHFFNDSLIAYQRRLVRRWLPAFINSEPVLVPDKPWELRSISMHGSVVAAPEGGYRMYYSAAGGVLVAFSEDGLTWTKPELDICPFEGKASNVLIPGITPEKRWSVASASVIVDDLDAKYPFKMTTYQKPDKSKEGALYVYRSVDGLHWEAIPGPRFEMGDRNAFMGSRIDGKIVGYLRKVRMFKMMGVRSLYRTESSDFLDFTEPQLALAPDLQDEPDVEFYGMPVFRRHGWFIGLLEYWRSDSDVYDIQLAFSRDGKSWQRPQPRASFIAPTYDWNRCSSHCAHNGPIFLNEQMAFYMGGTSTAHHGSTTPRDGVIGLASLETDRFCAMEGTTGEGWIDTIPLVWPGGDMVVNADTRESFASHPTYTNGTLFVEVLDAEGRQLPDWGGRKGRAVFSGNTHCREKIANGTILWPDGRNLDSFTGKTIRLRFVMKHARLFTFEARTRTPAPAKA